MPFSPPLNSIKTKGKNIKGASLERRILFQTWRFPCQPLPPLLELKTIRFMFDFLKYILHLLLPFCIWNSSANQFLHMKGCKDLSSQNRQSCPTLRLPPFCPALHAHRDCGWMWMMRGKMTPLPGTDTEAQVSTTATSGPLCLRRLERAHGFWTTTKKDLLEKC